MVVQSKSTDVSDSSIAGAEDFDEQVILLSNSQVADIVSGTSQDDFLRLKVDDKEHRDLVFFVSSLDDELSQKFNIKVNDFVVIPDLTDNTTKREVTLRRPSERVLQILRRVHSYQERYSIWRSSAAEEASRSVAYNLVEQLQQEVLPKSPEWIKNHDNGNNGDWTYLATRTRILNHMTSYLPDYEDATSWLTSPARFIETRQKFMDGTILPFLRNMNNVKGDNPEKDKSLCLHEFCNNIWNRFCIDFTNYFQNGSYHFILHSLTPMYMSVIIKKLREKEMVPAILSENNPGKNTKKITTNFLKKQVKHLSSSVLARCPRSKQNFVVNALKRYLVQTDWCNTYHEEIYDGDCIIVSLDQVSEWLYDLEQASMFLSRINELNIVRISQSKIKSVQPNKTSAIPATVSKKSAKSNNQSDDELSSHAESTDPGNVTSSTISGKGWSYSTSKGEGCRVYAEYSNGNYYWGTVAHVNPKTQKYLIHFEDGDILDNIPDKKIFTEVQYKKLFEEDPPSPVKPSKSALSRNERRGRRIIASWNQTTNTEPKRKRTRKSRGKEDVDSDSLVSDTVTSEPIKKTSEVRIRSRLPCCLPLFSQAPLKCGHCLHCRKGGEYCLQTVCIHMQEPAVGFPPDWTFYWSFESNNSQNDSRNFHVYRTVNVSHRRQDSEMCTPLRSLVVVSPNKFKYNNVFDAATAVANDSKEINWKSIVSSLLSHLGLDGSFENRHSFLKGKKYCHDWIDVQGKNHIVFGKIIDVVKDPTSKVPIFFKWYNNYCLKVEYSEVSLQLNNSEKEGIQIPGVDTIPNDLAWGGCVQYERKRRNQVPRVVHRNIDRTMPCKSWIIPEMRKEDTCEKGFPRLTVVVRGFQLVFTVKNRIVEGNQSVSDEYYVACNCKSIVDEDSSFFDLQAGELLDLGVCAPFSASDRKHYSVWNVKNYIFEQKCEEWTYMTDNKNYCYDLTDDTTGKVHDKAKSHLLSYINESPDEERNNQISCLHTEVDPAGHVHYLLGVAFRGIWKEYEEGMKKFNLSSSSKEVPIFADFGSSYENVRLRKRQSNLRNVEKNTSNNKNRSEKEKLTILKDMIRKFDYNQLFLILDYLSQSFLGKSKKVVDDKVKKRTQRIVCILNDRMETLKKGSCNSESEWDRMFETIDHISQAL